jgi:hypothetical protein
VEELLAVVFVPILIIAAPNLVTVELGQLTAAPDETRFAVLLVHRNPANEAFQQEHVEEAELETENAPTPVYAVQSGGIAGAVRAIAPVHRNPVGEGL